MSEPHALSPSISVSPQIRPDELPALASMGFRSIICNRPDDEEIGQPDWEDIAKAAVAVGMDVRDVPVRPGSISDDDVDRFRSALAALPAPVLAFCRSGARSASLWALAKSGSMPAEDILSAAAAAGYDLKPLGERLAGEPGASA